jgi:hypothetical protein
MAPSPRASRRPSLAQGLARPLGACARRPVVLCHGSLAHVLGSRADRRSGGEDGRDQGVPRSGPGPGGRGIRRPLARLGRVPRLRELRRLHGLGLGFAQRRRPSDRRRHTRFPWTALAEPVAAARRPGRDRDLGPGIWPGSGNRGARVRPAHRRRPRRAERACSRVVPPPQPRRRLAGIALSGRRNAHVRRLGGDRRDPDPAFGTARPEWRVRSRHGRRPDRVSRRAVPVSLVVALAAREAAQDRRHDARLRPRRQLGGDRRALLRLRDPAALFVGDTRTRRYVQITAQGGWTRVDASSLLVLYATGSKALDSRSAIAFVRLRDLPPIPACA